MALKASEIMQVVVLADQLFAGLVRLIGNVREISGADEATLKQQLAALRERNIQRFNEIEAQLANIAAGNPPSG